MSLPERLPCVKYIIPRGLGGPMACPDCGARMRRVSVARHPSPEKEEA